VELFLHQLVACEALNLTIGNVDHKRQPTWEIGWECVKPEVKALFRESKQKGRPLHASALRAVATLGTP
jgi:hypothetical protein